MKNKILHSVRLPLILICLAFSNFIYAVDCTYIGPESGTFNIWSNPANWSCGHVPTAMDNVVVNLTPSGFIRVDGVFEVNDFAFSGNGFYNGTNSTTSLLTINGVFNYTSGEINMNVTIASTGTLNVTTGTNLRPVSGTMTNNGITNISAKNGNDYVFKIFGTFVNNGTVNFTEPGILKQGTANSDVFQNKTSGTVNFNAPTDTVKLDVSWLNEGTMNVVQGNVKYTRAMNQTAGTLNVPIGSSFGVGNNGGTSSSNGVSADFTGGTVIGSGKLFAINLGAFQFFLPIVLNHSIVIKGGGVYFVNGESSLTGNIDMLLGQGHSALGTGTTTGNRLILTSTVTLNIANSTQLILEGVIRNGGTINWQSGTLSCPVVVNRFFNLPTGTININSTGFLSNFIVHNEGIININVARTFINYFKQIGGGTLNINQPVIFEYSTTELEGTTNINANVTAWYLLNFLPNSTTNWTDGNIITRNFSNSGTFNGLHAVDGTIDMTFYNAPNYNTIGNSGTMHLSNVTLISAHLENTGTLFLDNNINVMAYGYIQNQNIMHAGNSNLRARFITNNGNFYVDGSVVFVLGTEYTNSSTGTLRGTGSITKQAQQFNMYGAIRPGNSPGILSIIGSLSLGNATYHCEINGTNASDYDKFAISGTATLTGSMLNVVWGSPPIGIRLD
jgi:hypothetical protein